MLGQWSTTVYPTSTKEEELKPTRGMKREYLFIQNNSANDIYIMEGTRATSENGITIGAGQFYERGQGGGNCPLGTIYIKGSAATPQRVNVEEGYAAH